MIQVHALSATQMKLAWIVPLVANVRIRGRRSIGQVKEYSPLQLSEMSWSVAEMSSDAWNETLRGDDDGMVDDFGNNGWP